MHTPHVLRRIPAVLAVLTFLGPMQSIAQRPNVLWITCEDMSPVLGCYGDRFATTPHLDRFAAQGVRYTRAFAVGCVCTPSRSCLITGIYPVSLGSQHLRGPITLPPGVRGFPEYLRKSGYYCTNNFKEDYNFTAPPGTWDESSPKAHWRNRRPGQPFFSVFNIMCTHQGQIRLPDDQFAKVTARLAPRDRHDPLQVPLPPYYPDTPLVRRDMARFYDLVTAMDLQVGDRLRELDEDRLADDTIVFFYSDHGNGMPRHKRAVYDSGILVPLIVRFPEKFHALAPAPAGHTVDRLVSFLDFGPTVLSLAGLPIPEAMQGRAMLGPAASDPPPYLFSLRDRVDECFEMSRAVRGPRYKYIRNFFPHRPYLQLSDYSEPAATVQELRRLDAAGKLVGPQKLYLRRTKPAEELYDTQTDPYELTNLAESPEHRAILEPMRSALHDWMLRVRDTGLIPEAELFRRAGRDTIAQMARDDGRFPVARVLEAAELVGRAPDPSAQISRLSDPEPAVRYWAAVGLSAPGANPRRAVDALRKALGDPVPDVRIAAAEALCGADVAAEALPILVAALDHDDSRVRLHAMAVLVAIGPKAAPAVPALRRLLAAPDRDEYSQYARWAAGHVFRGLGLDVPETPAPAKTKKLAPNRRAAVPKPAPLGGSPVRKIRDHAAELTNAW